ncbi:MAG TPA: triose-phosphate isomerase [Candidatus Saccharimonadales bacterium]|nr:triose-phosphate isomerase [Candidatus Saccharimonadales bacterium]
MKHFTIVGNWKMHQAPEQAERLVGKLQEKVKPQTHVTTVLCPPFVSLPAVAKKAEKDVFRVGAQNLHPQDEGAFTGEVSGPMLKDLCEYVIIGHSERRRDEGETDKLISQKVAAAIRNGLKPVLCIGEKLDDRQEGHSKRVINDQLHGCLSQITDDDLADVIICYEPVWAISTGDGHGTFAKPGDVKEMLSQIRHIVEELFGEGASSQVKLLYGGSVNKDDCEAYLELEHCDGLLVGGASLKPEEFPAIIESAAKLAK